MYFQHYIVCRDVCTVAGSLVEPSKPLNGKHLSSLNIKLPNAHIKWWLQFYQRPCRSTYTVKNGIGYLTCFESLDTMVRFWVFETRKWHSDFLCAYVCVCVLCRQLTTGQLHRFLILCAFILNAIQSTVGPSNNTPIHSSLFPPPNGQPNERIVHRHRYGTHTRAKQEKPKEPLSRLSFAVVGTSFFCLSTNWYNPFE